MKMLYIVFVTLFCTVTSATVVELEWYNIDRNKMSVSGFSSGAIMATQMHVAHSSQIMGMGSIAGIPFYCAKGSVFNTGSCTATPALININTLISKTNEYDSQSKIDSTSNMQNDKVYIFHGTLDFVINVGNGNKIKAYYQNYMSAANIATDFTLAAGHGFPTVNYGVACGATWSPFINNCNFDAAYAMLNHIYGGLVKPTSTTPTPGDFLQFDQNEFFYDSSPLASSMDTSGYVYVPSGCRDKTSACKLHVAFHGCQQGKQYIQDEFAKEAGYNKVGELNNIIILYPQAVWTFLNTGGCWDWWGYNGEAYATRDGNQIKVVKRMMDKISLP